MVPKLGMAATQDGDQTRNVSEIPAAAISKGPASAESQLLASPKDDVESSASSPATSPSFPEGGWGWVQVVASFFLLFCTAGPQWSLGTYVRFYTAEHTFPGATYFAISFIPSLCNLGFPLFGPFAGKAADYFGPRRAALVGVAIQVVGLILASFSTEVWHVLLTQGFLFGTGEVLIYLAFVNAISQYFLKRRGMAIGIAISGSGIGGLVLSPVTQIIIDAVGWRWSLRILAIIVAALGGLCAMLYLARVPSGMEIRKRGSQEGAKKPARTRIFDLQYFKDAWFTILYLSGAITGFGYFIPFSYVVAYATSIGITSSSASLILGLMNGAGACGRMFWGIAGDRIGHVNAFLLCQFGAPLAILLVWPFATSFASTAIMGMLFGFFAAGFISVMPLVMTTLAPDSSVAGRLGLQMSSSLINTLAGPPIGGALLDANTSFVDGVKVVNYLPTTLYGGSLLLVGALPLLWVRWKAGGGRWWSKI
ncbi:MFS general substrate transporter [Gonapodya prolifera JEL478]|uniref:MFS general substrate transporter n=1 Tax=Gonapodya prolifera (strain JEL478) TaxID=1344416 RepID=A0A138ZXT9_GONPJ|nr:MFS general substrate transporter [Gonapodya prolifera JEL478]|eukprot:KXS08963.1 MFS general substrate transporter [Gonapodya prolifera JEL478]